VDRQLPTTLGDDSGPLEDRQKTAGGLSRRPGQLREIRLGGSDEYIAIAAPLCPGCGHKLKQHPRNSALHRLKRLPGEPLVCLA
jgi:hypothetical protein